MNTWHLAMIPLAAAWLPASFAAGPGNLREAVDLDPDPHILEIDLVAARTTVDLGGVSANAFTFNGAIPGPELRLRVGDEVIAHFTNHLFHQIFQRHNAIHTAKLIQHNGHVQLLPLKRRQQRLHGQILWHRRSRAQNQP